MDNHYFLIHLKFLAEVTGIAVLPDPHPLGIPSHSLPSDGSKHQTQTCDMGGCPIANIPVCRNICGMQYNNKGFPPTTKLAFFVVLSL